MLNQDEVMHIGADFVRQYQATTSDGELVDLSNASAVCKIRDPKGELLLTAECSIENSKIVVCFPYGETLQIDSKIKKGKYDVFVQTIDKSYKLVYGEIQFIHDISMH